MSEVNTASLRWFLWAVALPFVAAAALALLAMVGYLLRFNDQVVLPNEMVVKRQFDFTRQGRQDLFAPDGTTRLARAVEFICFNDRFVYATSYERTQGGYFDGLTRAWSRKRDYDALVAAGATADLLPKGKTCDGYYTGMLGPSLLYGDPAPFEPPCQWRNLGNPTLLDRGWLDRPCGD
jgi:hypothetical protein